MTQSRILRVSRPVADPARAAAFYQRALGFGRAGQGLARLGGQDVALVPGPAPLPPGRSDDLWFHHLAIVVADMDAAYAHLCSVEGWQAITAHGPQLLPPENGSVRAFKFRDPDGNALELIWFPPGQGRAVWHQESVALFLGIDHAALSVSGTERSVAFYHRLGLRVANRTMNRGRAQSLLDGLPDASVEVTSLRPDAADSIGLELLAYRPPGRAVDAHRRMDCVTLCACGAPAGALRDPDGHQFVIVPTTREDSSG